MSRTMSQRSECSASKTSARAWNLKNPVGEGVARERSIGLFARVKEIWATEPGKPRCVGKHAFPLKLS